MFHRGDGHITPGQRRGKPAPSHIGQPRRNFQRCGQIHASEHDARVHGCRAKGDIDLLPGVQTYAGSVDNICERALFDVPSPCSGVPPARTGRPSLSRALGAGTHGWSIPAPPATLPPGIPSSPPAAAGRPGCPGNPSRHPAHERAAPRPGCVSRSGGRGAGSRSRRRCSA